MNGGSAGFALGPNFGGGGGVLLLKTGVDKDASRFDRETMDSDAADRA